MTDNERPSQEPSEEELAEGPGESPEREVINANVAAPVNAAVALNSLSEDSRAIANAKQNADAEQVEQSD